jgi:hypothetical protein
MDQLTLLAVLLLLSLAVLLAVLALLVVCRRVSAQNRAERRAAQQRWTKWRARCGCAERVSKPHNPSPLQYEDVKGVEPEHHEVVDKAVKKLDFLTKMRDYARGQLVHVRHRVLVFTSRV